MNDWAVLALLFWGAFVYDGLRRHRHARHAITRALIWGHDRADFVAVRFAPLLPWQWRLWSDDPTVAFSPLGIANQVSGSAGRPTEVAPTASFWRWEEIHEVGEAGGTLYINGRAFAPAVAALRAERLWRLVGELAPLAEPARAARLERELRLWFRPTHWQRRWRVARLRTRWVAWLNSITLVTAAGLSAAGLTFWQKPFPEIATLLVKFSPHLAAVGAASYVAGVVLALRAARALARWQRPGVRGAIWGAALFPPQGLRWRAVLTEALTPAPHPLLPIALGASNAARNEAAFHVLTDLAHPLKLPSGTPPEVAAIRSWFAAALEKRVAKLLQRADVAIDRTALLAPPAADDAASCAYCPRCHAQFTRPDALCPHGVALRPLQRGTNDTRS